MTETNSNPRCARPSLPDGYELRETTPTVEEFRRLRRSAGMTDRPTEAVADGLSNTTHGVHVVRSEDDEAVGMARIVGDGATAFLVVDVAVAETHQGTGLGTAMMDALMNWLRANAPNGGFVYLFADVGGFYERWGFEPSAPASAGMWIRTGEL